MAISKKAYAKKFGDALVENPRKFLRGHKIKSSAWKLFTPEVGGGAMLAELMYMAHSLTGAKKGPMALKRADNFMIRTYKTEGLLIDSLVDDVDEFVSGLSEKDAEQFEDTENIHVIGYFPAFAKGDPVQRLKLSVLLRNGYKGKFGKGEFVVVFFGNSAIRTTELTFAKAKAKVNAKKVAKTMSPAKVKARLKTKSAKVIGKIDKKVAGLSAEAQLLSAEMQEFAALGADFGLEGDFSTSDLNNALLTNDYANEELLSGMSETEKGVWSVIKKEMKKNPKSRMVKSLVKSAGSEAITALYNDSLVSSDDKVTGRTKAMKAKVVGLNKRNKMLAVKMEELAELRGEAVDAGDKREAFRIGKNIAAAKHAIKKNTNVIKKLKTKLGVHKNLGKSGVSYEAKAEMLSKVNAEVEKLTAMGATERQALAGALKKIDVDSVTKEELGNNIQQAIQEGVPAQIATQQAFQEVPFQQISDDFVDVEGGSDLDDIVMDWL